MYLKLGKNLQQILCVECVSGVPRPTFQGVVSSSKKTPIFLIPLKQGSQVKNLLKMGHQYKMWNCG